ncbi:MAG TPA: CSLREA domain-containing protein [Solirubrobacteraceae bacterium]|jgi:CSLREA domain-containing protein
MTQVRVGLVALVLAAALAAPAGAATTFTVNTTADGAAPCGATCTLRGAIRSANETAGPDTVVIPADATPYALTLVGAGEDANATGDLDVLESVTIQGAGASGVVIDANGLGDGVIHGVADTATVDISGVTIRGADLGTGYAVRGTGPHLTLTDSVLRDNGSDLTAYAGSGNDKPTDLTLTRVLLRDNTSDNAIVEHGPDTDGTLRIVDTQLLHNTTAGTLVDADPGGGTTTAVIVTGSTFDDNTIDSYGIDVNPSGAVANASLEVAGSSFTRNKIDRGRGLIDFDPSSFDDLATSIRITDTLFADTTINRDQGVLVVDPCGASGKKTSIDSRLERTRFERNVTGDDVNPGEAAAIALRPCLPNGGAQHFALVDSLLAGNEAHGDSVEGGAFSASATGATIDVSGSTFTQNGAGTVANGNTGGAIELSDGAMTIVNSTFDGNHVGFGDDEDSGGGAIHAAGGSLALVHTTLTQNTVTAGAGDTPDPAAGGGALKVDGGVPVTVTASLLHGNTAYGAAQDCLGPVASGGSNLAATTTCSLGGPADQQGVADAGLAPLANNGGPTPTRALSETSPAKDAARGETCLATDQRGVTRPQFAACDIGAFELAPSSPPADAPPPPPPPPPVVPQPPKPDPLLLTCGRTQLALIDVVRAGGKVRITGQAALALAGRQVQLLVSDRRNRKRKAAPAGTATIGPDGTFAATVKRPGRRLRSPQYLARAGGTRSVPLELDRRMYVDGLSVAGGRITLRGHVTRPLPRRGSTVAIFVQRDCTTRTRVAKAKLDRRGRFSAEFPAPAGVPEILVRAQTKVPTLRGGRATARTFTLPRPLKLG